MRNLKPLLFIIVAMLILTLTGVTIQYLSASGDGTEPPEMSDPEPIDVVELEVVEGFFHCQVELRDDLHRPDAFFGVVEAFPAGAAQWAVITTHSHTAETLGYTLIRMRGVSVPTQFADRTRPLIFAERERERFDRAMSYVWSLISQSETLILRDPEAIEGQGYVLCDVFVKVGGHELNLAEMMINDGHARPTGNWDWGARDVAEIVE